MENRNQNQKITSIRNIKAHSITHCCQSRRVVVQIQNHFTCIHLACDNLKMLCTQNLVLRLIICTEVFCQMMDCILILCAMVHQLVQMVVFRVNRFTYTIHRKSFTIELKIYSIRIVAALKMYRHRMH